MDRRGSATDTGAVVAGRGLRGRKAATRSRPGRGKRARPGKGGKGAAGSADAQDVLIGLLDEAADAVRRGASMAGRLVAGTGRIAGAVVRPLWGSALFTPLRRPAEALVARGAEEWERLGEIGRADTSRTKKLTHQLIQGPVDEVVASLRDDPALAEVVRSQAETLLRELAEDPGLSDVVRAQGDAFVDHLREDPAPVRELVREQSTGLASSFAAIIRRWNLRNDAVAERVARRLVRRPAILREELPRGAHYAGIASRGTGFLIDLASLSAATIVGAWLWTSLLSIFGLELLDCAAYGEDEAVRRTLCQLSALLGLAVAAALPTAYTILFWVAMGQTPGKAVTGVRIVRLDGSPIGIRDSCVRLVAYLVSFWTLGLGFLAMLVDDRRQAWHDKIARTCVIYVRPDDAAS